MIFVDIIICGGLMNKYIDCIIDLARKANDLDDIPVGAIVVYKDKIIGTGFNTRNATDNVVGHAEINAIIEASKYIGDWRLDDCTLYVTLKPCLMCSSVIDESRIHEVFYLIDRTNVQSKYNFDFVLNKINDDYRVDEYLKLLQKFFENKRNK